MFNWFTVKTADQIMSGFTKVIKDLELAASKAYADAQQAEIERIAAGLRVDSATAEAAKATNFKTKLEALFN